LVPPPLRAAAAAAAAAALVLVHLAQPVDVAVRLVDVRKQQADGGGRRDVEGDERYQAEVFDQGAELRGKRRRGDDRGG